jgi:hypothetical protein
MVPAQTIRLRGLDTVWGLIRSDTLHELVYVLPICSEMRRSLSDVVCTGTCPDLWRHSRGMFFNRTDARLSVRGFNRVRQVGQVAR